jgi:hypothetical protein
LTAKEVSTCTSNNISFGIIRHQNKAHWAGSCSVSTDEDVDIGTHLSLFPVYSALPVSTWSYSMEL